jgi:acylphosphatase
MRRTRRYLVRGDVQGVGFRAFVARQARDLGLDGWVRNRNDGTVEVLVTGDDDALQQLHAAVTRGPRMSRVDGVNVSDESQDERTPPGFQVRPTV